MAKTRKEIHLSDQIAVVLLRVVAWCTIALFVMLFVLLLYRAWPSLKQFGFSFFSSKEWDPVQEVYGAAVFVYGTAVSSLLAIIIATPISVGTALFLSELAPRSFAAILGFLVEMLAAIPSVIYGLWGIFVLAPWLRTSVEPYLKHILGFLPFFDGPVYGVGMLAGGIILAIMIVPTISAVCRDVFTTIPQMQREAVLALGATRWESIKIAVLQSSVPGIFGAVMLGLGRALGETMAVTMVIGNRNDIAFSLFAPSQTMASLIANEYSEATSDLHLSALAEIGIVLLLLSLLINSAARVIIWRMREKQGMSRSK